MSTGGEGDREENMEDSCDDDDEKRIEFQYMTAPYRYRPSLSPGCTPLAPPPF